MKPPLIVAFLTGMSDPRSCALSPEQDFFLTQLSAPDRELARTNFPYTVTGPFRKTSLLRASWNNLRLYFSSRRSDFIDQYRERVCSLIERGEHVFFLAGSCGLELFNNLELPLALEKRCTVLCYGPAARRLPRFARAIVVQGSYDFISRPLFRPSHRRLSCGHLGYLRKPEFLRLCRAELSLHSSASCNSISV